MKNIHILLSFLILLSFALANLCEAQTVSTPILSLSPKTGAFLGVQVGSTRAITFTIKNAGVSVLKIKKIEITGSKFTLTDTNTYPFEVVSDTGFSFPMGNSGKSLKFTVNFNPDEIGVQTGKVIITRGLWSDDTYEVPLTGEGLSCSAAIAAKTGENRAPRQDIWFKYTADRFSFVEVSSCHPNQVNPVSNPYPLLPFYVYDGCNGPLIPEIDEWTGICQFDRHAVPVRTEMNAGQTIYIFWPQLNPGSSYATDGFYFNINATYFTDGDVCENAIPLTLPVINLFGNTRGIHDDYDTSPCSIFTNYMEGNDKVYTISLPEEGYLTGDIIGAYGSIHVLDECPKTELAKDHCKAFTGGPNGGHFRTKIAAGTYFVIVSNWAPPQTLDYLLNMSWEGVSGFERDNLSNTLNVYPNPARDKFTISVNQDAPTDLTLELVDISGQVVYRNEVRAVYGFQEELDSRRFAGGVYYLRVNNGRELAIKKVVIE